ncbi:MAG TPA: hypothetical protein VEH27_14180, partial [Methylomirabilota bacterium]|nr:hypothetical protein [Methylomirabilota bacterium]
MRTFTLSSAFRTWSRARRLLGFGGLFAVAVLARGATVLPLEFEQSLVPYNYSSLGGVPISQQPGVPAGSNGKQPTPASNQSGTALPATGGQFQGFVPFGGGLDLRSFTNPPTSFEAWVRVSGIPAGFVQGHVQMALRRVQIGVPYVSRPASFLFGSVIPRPDTDENGAPLTNALASQYWLPQPYLAPGQTNPPYYWSPHAQVVYAIEAGPVSITWQKAESTTVPPADYTTNSPNYLVQGGHFFRLYTTTYIVSGSPVKQPRKIYWTEKTFQGSGKLVNVPSARVKAINIVYNNNFPRTVSAEYVDIGQSNAGDGSTNSSLPELRTLWFEHGNIHAHNQEGRVFVELLGDANADGITHQPLGFEVVDVFKQVNPIDVQVELGERIVPPSPGSLTELHPEPIQQPARGTYAFSHAKAGSEFIEFYANRETQNLNDYLVHWMEEGVVGLRWPSMLARYQLVWPDDIEKYTHYVRPVVQSESEAQATAVALSTDNVPNIDYQDPLDTPRAKLTGDFRFYTYLSQEFPAHRTLLHYTAGDNIAFERVFSWLNTSLEQNSFFGSVATNLAAWNSVSNTLQWADDALTPRVVRAKVKVGQRIEAPTGEAGSTAGAPYVAGHVRQPAGNSFNPYAYVDPFTNATLANLGAIIPVNAIPGSNQLEVWWFRSNSVNTLNGFKKALWPSVIGIYSIEWPSDEREIVLASNKGSAGSEWNPLVGLGSIYSQNDPELPGYNPNEEHALMQGGGAFALRDDLNITEGANYSSQPYVLVQYRESDNRPAMAVYKVRREKPEAGVMFDYIVSAGSLLQPPAPLGLLPPPVEGTGDSVRNYNTETSHRGGDLPIGWSHNDGTGPLGYYSQFTYRDRKNGFWVYRGQHAGLPALEAGHYDKNGSSFTTLPAARFVAGSTSTYYIHASREEQYLQLALQNAPSWLTAQGLRITATPPAGLATTLNVSIVVSDRYDGSSVPLTLAVTVSSTGNPTTQGPMVIASTNIYGEAVAFTNRPPLLAQSPVGTNSFTMQFYYPTQPGFDWPGVANPPAVGAIVPYLRPLVNDEFVGDATSKTTPSLEIVYRPVWPSVDPADESKAVPTMPYGQTLTEAVNGLPGVRDFKTAMVLYQQSIAQAFASQPLSAVLHDPTRQKTSDLATQGLTTLPGGVQTQDYQGRVYFPQLPLHLSTRVFFDPTIGSKGSLCFQGQIVNDVTGSYVLLNVLSSNDLASVTALCPATDPNAGKWTALVAALTTAVEVFHESSTVPGTYVADTNLTALVGAQALAAVTNQNTAVDTYALTAVGPGSGYITIIEGGGTAFTTPGDPVALHIIKVGGSLYSGALKIVASPNPLSEQITLQHNADMAAHSSDYEYQWKIGAPVDGVPPFPDRTMSNYLALVLGQDIPRYTLGGAGVQALSDNYLVLRYRPTNPAHPLYKASPTEADWSAWTPPQLVEGWIKRVLAGINPFNQRTTDLFNNTVTTDASIIAQAGRRWEGDVALNADTLNSHGLIEIYETVLRRGRLLSIEGGYNYGPANDALLLAAGYLNDLYMMLGNEAAADAANPTIGIGTKDNAYGDIATALFSFKGQEPSLLEEELALLRGRDDSLQPGVQVAPFYNRLVWNYTRGIDSGEVIYAINYDVKDQDHDGVVNASDAAALYPQAHGDAYGHFLTALKGYYSLLMNPNFDWVPRIEAVTVAGQAVAVDYLDERKFATAAAGVATTGRKVFDLTWRRDYQPSGNVGWDYLSATRVNASRSNNAVRYWGLDHWASRTGQGGYLSWLAGNAILPATDPNPDHEGIQKVDRTTVPELQLLAFEADALQSAMDSAEAGLTPLGLAEGSLAFDIDPTQVVGGQNGSHFEQVYQRAKVALNNAVIAFDDAKDVTRRMRSEQDSLDDFQAGLLRQEMAFTNALVELFGTPYSDDIGPGKQYPQGYTGPDFFHYAYVDSPQITFGSLLNPVQPLQVKIDIQDYSDAYNNSTNKDNFDFYARGFGNSNQYVVVNLDGTGNFIKPAGWTGSRSTPGQLQEAVSRILAARNAAAQALSDNTALKRRLDRSVEFFQTELDVDSLLHANDTLTAISRDLSESALYAGKVGLMIYKNSAYALQNSAETADKALPKSTILGLANGGDILSGARAAIWATYAVAQEVGGVLSTVKEAVVGAFELGTSIAARQRELNVTTPAKRMVEHQRAVVELDAMLDDLQGSIFTINQRLQELDAALRNYQSLVMKGNRILQEREVARQRAAAIVQGYRTRDAAFRLFRDEKLERYQTLLELASRYAYLAANAYDYETGMLGTPTGQQFLSRIVNSRALGVVRNGEPQYAGSDTGDPGLSSALAELKADWDVLRGRLGFNNPDAYGTTASLRVENYRILPGTNGLANWQTLLLSSQRANLLDDADIRRHCMQLGGADGLNQPGMVLEFSTTIAQGFNLFGQPLAAGDHAYSPSSFATKLFAAGVAFEGYRGMDNPSANST